MKNIDIGRLGEEEAIKFLKSKGYKVLERNARSKIGEIDIVAKTKKEIVFIEVKTRSSEGFGFPSEAVNRRKILKLEGLALLYLQKKRIKLPFRFEILCVLKEGKNFRFDIIPFF